MAGFDEFGSGGGNYGPVSGPERGERDTNLPSKPGGKAQVQSMCYIICLPTYVFAKIFQVIEDC